MSELKPCPFCGDDNLGHAADCYMALCKLPDLPSPAVMEAAWNRRATHPQPVTPAETADGRMSCPVCGDVGDAEKISRWTDEFLAERKPVTPVGGEVEKLRAEKDAIAIKAHGYMQELESLRDPAAIGESLMATIARNRPDYVWSESPAEIVSDLLNEIDEVKASNQPAGMDVELVGEVYTMEALVPGGAVKYHATITKPVPAGTKLYTHPPVADAALPRGHRVDDGKQLAMIRDAERLDWLEQVAFTTYRTRDPETGRLYSHVTFVNEDKAPRRGITRDSFRESIDAAMQDAALNQRGGGDNG